MEINHTHNAQELANAYRKNSDSEPFRLLPDIIAHTYYTVIERGIEHGMHMVRLNRQLYKSNSKGCFFCKNKKQN